MSLTPAEPEATPGKAGSQSLVLPFVLAAIGGVVLWIAASFISGKREAWDAGFYWTVAYPAAIALSGLLGFLWPKASWRWPLVLFLFQFVGMVIRNAELGGLWPLGMILFAVLSVPGVVLARLAARFRERMRQP
jgi:hypothetical protein